MGSGTKNLTKYKNLKFPNMKFANWLNRNIFTPQVIVFFLPQNMKILICNLPPQVVTMWNSNTELPMKRTSLVAQW